jgi:hypothetical protein
LSYQKYVLTKNVEKVLPADLDQAIQQAPTVYLLYGSHSPQGGRDREGERAPREGGKDKFR